MRDTMETYFYRMVFGPSPRIICRDEEAHQPISIDELKQAYEGFGYCSMLAVNSDGSIIVEVNNPPEMHRILSLFNDGTVKEIKLVDLAEMETETYDSFKPVEGKPYSKGIRRNIAFNRNHQGHLVADRKFIKPGRRVSLGSKVEILAPKDVLNENDIPYFHPDIFEGGHNIDDVDADAFEYMGMLPSIEETEERYKKFIELFAPTPSPRPIIL